MHFLKTLPLLLIAVILSACQSHNANTPYDQLTFNYRELEGTGCRLLAPDEWFFAKESKGNAYTFYSTKENLAKTGQFETGFSMIALRHIAPGEGQPANYIYNLYKASREDFDHEHTWKNPHGPFAGLGFIYVDEDESGKSRVFNQLTANKNTGSVYIMVFEAPVDEWAQAWPVGQQMIQRVLLNSSF